MTDLAAFLTARLDEDEQLARAATVRAARHPPRDHWQVGHVITRDDYTFVSICTPLPDVVEIAGSGFDGTGGVHGERFAEHMARWDPARVLAETTAKRQILERHMVNVEVEGPPPPFPDPHVRYQEGCITYWCNECDHDRDYGHIPGPDEGCPTLRALAAPFADHPDYDPAWRISD